MTSVISVVGNPKRASRTLTAATELADQLSGVFPVERKDVIDLADIGSGLLAPWSLSPEAAAAVAAIREATVLIVATPTYKASFTGLLKLLLDTLAAGSLARTVVLPVTVHAGPAHRHLADWQLRPVLGELGAVLPAPSLLLAENELDQLPDVVGRHLGTHGPLIAAAVHALTRAS